MPSTARCLILALLVLQCASWGGCGSLRALTRRDKVEEELDHDPNLSIAGIQGPTERALQQKLWQRQREELENSGDQGTQQALKDYDAAQALFDQGKFAEAEKAFAAVAKSRQDSHESWRAKFLRAWGSQDKLADDPYSNFGDAIEEDALFMTGESQFAQKHYADAQNSYDDLLNRYPSTRHLDRVTRQLFRIARYWLDFPEDVGDTGDAQVQLASTEEVIGESATAQPKSQPSSLSRIPIFPNLTDETRPLFDTYGRGELALRSIWLHDATGPLADDALMLAANHNLRTEDFVEARRLYKLLREQYPDSPHLRDAYLLGSHVTLASYQGPAYDGQSLEEARELKQTMLQVFPNIPEDQRQALQKEVDQLKEAEVARVWDLVEYYSIKNEHPAVKLHCYLILNRYPDSRFAEMARQRLKQVEQEERERQNSLWYRMTHETPRPRRPTPPQEPQRTASAAEPPAAQTAAPPPTQQQKRQPARFPFNLLRRAEEPPELQPAEPTAEQPPEAPREPGRITLEKNRNLR